MKKVAVFVLLIAAVFAFVFLGREDALESARTDIIGVWGSSIDEKFTREFRSDGTLIDAYENSAPNVGYWTLFTSAMPPQGYTESLREGTIYLAITIPNTEALYFSLSNVDERTLEMTYLNRGGTLMFAKVK